MVTGVSEGVATITAQDATNPGLFGHSYVTVKPSSPPKDTGMQLGYDAIHSGNYTPVAGATGTTVSQCWTATASQFQTGDIFCNVVVSNGVVYLGSAYTQDLNGNVYALNATTGALIWSYNVGGSVQEIAVGNGKVYAVQWLDGAAFDILYALNATTGSLDWTYQAGDSW